MVLCHSNRKMRTKCMRFYCPDAHSHASLSALDAGCHILCVDALCVTCVQTQHAFQRTRTSSQTFIKVHSLTHIHMSTQTHTHIHTPAHTDIHSYIHTHMHTYILTCLLAHVQIYIHSFAHTSIRARAHTHHHNVHTRAITQGQTRARTHARLCAAFGC